MGVLKTAKAKRQLCLSYAVFMLNGMLALSIGSLLPFIRESRELNYAFAGLIVSLHSVGNLISSFACGALGELIGRKKSILIFNSLFAIAYLLIIFGTNNWCLALAFLTTGLARGATSNFVNVAINELAPGRAGIMNGLHATFSVGAFLFPIFLTVLTRSNTENWIIACYYMVVMGVLSWVFYFLNPTSDRPEKKKEKKAGSFGFFREPIFYFVTFTLFFYLCAEQGVIGWMITYFVDTGLLSDTLSQLMASVLWIMILIGRLGTAWLSGRRKKENMLPFMGMGIIFFFFWLLISRSTPLIIIGIMGFGISMAGIYPTTVSFSGHLIQKYSIAWSFILTIASFGSILMPSIIGHIAEAAGIVYGMSSVVVVILIDFTLIIGMCTYIKKQTGGNENENSEK